MSEEQAGCPKCGGALTANDDYGTRTWDCGSMACDDGVLWQTHGCLNRQVAALTAENARLREALALVEWCENIGRDAQPAGAWCYGCHAPKGFGHYPKCPIDAALHADGKDSP